MKHSLSIVIALVAFITLYSFSNQKKPESGSKQVTVVLVYNSGNQSAVASYSQSQTSVVPACPGAVRLCAIRTTDPNNDGVISQTEFTAIFNALDTNSNGTLDDQTETTVLFKKA